MLQEPNRNDSFSPELHANGALAGLMSLSYNNQYYSVSAGEKAAFMPVKTLFVAGSAAD